MCENAQPVDWNDLKYLLALKRAGTLAGAARELAVDHSTVSVRGALLAMTQGVGIGTMPCYLAASEPLRRMTPEVTANTEIFLVTTPDLQDLKRIRLVLEAVATMFDRNRALFAGTLA